MLMIGYCQIRETYYFYPKGSQIWWYIFAHKSVNWVFGVGLGAIMVKLCLSLGKAAFLKAKLGREGALFRFFLGTHSGTH